MRIPVTYEGHQFIAVADSAGLDVECVGKPTEYVMGLARKLWNEIYSMREQTFGAEVTSHDTTNGELTATLHDLKLI